VHITRREFTLGTGALTLTGLGTLIGFSVADTGRPALAQNPPLAELMQPGPLGDMSIGEEKAPVTIIEYASMTCPHCAAFHETTYQELKKKYVDTGKVRFIFREFPLDQLGRRFHVGALRRQRALFPDGRDPVPAATHMGGAAAPAAAYGHQQAGRPQRGGLQ
jgi:hypothetical protein